MESYSRVRWTPEEEDGGERNKSTLGAECPLNSDFHESRGGG